MNVLWTHSFINGNHEKAEKIWNDFLKDSPRIMFQKVVQTARERQDEELTKKLIEHLNVSKVTEGALGNAYSCLLDVLIAKDKTDEVIDTFERVVKEVPLTSINRTAILRTQAIYNKLGKEFNYQIPPKSRVQQPKDTDE